MPAYSKPHGDFQNQTQIADATQVNDQINQLYTAVNGGLDGTNVPNLGDMTTVTTTAKNAAGAINEIAANYPIFAMSRQALINGNFDIWQRGMSLNNPSSGSFLADRYLIAYSPDSGVLPVTVQHTKLTLTQPELPGSKNAYRISPDGAGSGFGVNASYGIFQRIENATTFLCGSGKKLTLSFWARSSIAGKRLGISFSQRYGSGGSPSAAENIPGQIITLTAAWTKYTVTINTNTLSGKTFGTNNDDYFQIGFYVMWGTTTATSQFGGGTAEAFAGAGTIDIGQIQFNGGDQALPFQPRSFADELLICQRYYEKSYNYSVFPGVATDTGAKSFRTGSSVAGSSTGGLIHGSDIFKVRKRVNPTITIYSPSGATGAVRVQGTTDRTGATANLPSENGIYNISLSAASATAIALNDLIDYQYTADSEL